MLPGWHHSHALLLIILMSVRTHALRCMMTALQVSHIWPSWHIGNLMVIWNLLCRRSSTDARRDGRWPIKGCCMSLLLILLCDLPSWWGEEGIWNATIGGVVLGGNGGTLTILTPASLRSGQGVGYVLLHLPDSIEMGSDGRSLRGRLRFAIAEEG